MRILAWVLDGFEVFLVALVAAGTVLLAMWCLAGAKVWVRRRRREGLFVDTLRGLLGAVDALADVRPTDPVGQYAAWRRVFEHCDRARVVLEGEKDNEQ